MNKEELAHDIYYELRCRFQHTTDPYRDATSWALNEFFAEYVANKLAVHRATALGDIKHIGYKCLRCGRGTFEAKAPHNCDSGFRKRNLRWRPVFA